MLWYPLHTGGDLCNDFQRFHGLFSDVLVETVNCEYYYKDNLSW